MANLIHTFSVEDDIIIQKQEFLEPISIFINELKQPFTCDIKEKKNKIKVIIKTANGNKTVFKKKFKTPKKTVKFLSMTEEEAIAMAKAQGMIIEEEVPELMPAIGFAVPTEDDFYDEEEYEDE